MRSSGLKNNRGFTLVELLVAMAVLMIVLVEVYSVMNSSSTIFSRSSSEIALQSEAQQVKTQIEDLMIDCNGRIDYDVSGNKISILNKDGINCYEVTWVASASDNAGSLDGYGQVYLQKFGTATGSSNAALVKGAAVDTSPVLMADYVRSLSLDMAEYANDRVVLYCDMQGTNSTYTMDNSASETLFLRNMIGSGGGGSAIPPAASPDYNIKLLRYQTIDLNNRYLYSWSTDEDGDGFKETKHAKYYDKFAFEDGGNSSLSGKWYNLSSANVLSTTTTACNSGNWDKEFGPYDIIGEVSSESSAPKIRIRVSTDEVSFATEDKFLMPLNARTTTDMIYLNGVLGIDISKASEISYTYYFSCPNAGVPGNKVKITTSDCSGTVKATNKASIQGGATPDDKIFATSEMKPTVTQNYNLDTSGNKIQTYDPQLEGHKFFVDPVANAFGVYGARMNETDLGNLIKSIQNGNFFYASIEIKWTSPSNSKTIICYPVPVAQAGDGTHDYDAVWNEIYPGP